MFLDVFTINPIPRPSAELTVERQKRKTCAIFVL